MHTSLSVYLDESRSHATMTFCEKISSLLFSKGLLMPFITNAERQLPVPLDKGNEGSEDETGRLRAGSLHVIPG